MNESKKETLAILSVLAIVMLFAGAFSALIIAIF